MRRSAYVTVTVLITLLFGTGCGSTASPSDVYWDAYGVGEQIDTTPTHDPNCADGIDPNDTAKRIMACAGFGPNVGEECGKRLPSGVDSVNWMEGCSDGAYNHPNYRAYGPRPQ